MLNQKAIEIALSKVDDAISAFSDLSDRAAKAANSLKVARRILKAAADTSHAPVAPDYSDYIAAAAAECGTSIGSVAMRGSKWIVAIKHPSLAETFADILAQNLGRKGYDVDVWCQGYVVFIADAIHD